MSVLTNTQRQVVRADTGVDPILIDRVADAYERLLKDDVEGYKQHMANALAQQNIPVNQLDNERRTNGATAVDIIKTICIKSIADERHWSFERTAQWLFEAASK